jgi:pyrimidine-nucleoside phosphorylase
MLDTQGDEVMSTFKDIVDSFIIEASDSSMGRLIAWFGQNEANDQDIAYLAKALAQSGAVLRYEDGRVRADIASTGGPGSLTTILSPLFLRSFGFAVPKLGVPGRPAGGIDVLAQISGYRYELTEQQIGRILSESGYVHFLASDRFAPMDAKFFEYRKTHGALARPPLVIASILAKKIAVGVQLAGLDVRISPHGNFGSTLNIARDNALCFCRVAALVGCEGVCFLTDNAVPPQPFIGRGEALVALSLYFEGRAPVWLQNHVDMCYAMSRSLAARMSVQIPGCPSRSALMELFGDHLRAQGTSLEAFKERVAQVQEEPTSDIQASEDGFMVVDLNGIRDTITRFQARAADGLTHFPDPCGITLKKSPGQYVRKSDKIASIRFPTGADADLASLFDDSIRVQPLPQRGLMFEEVSYE